jgi:hypothetical protein
MADYKRHIENMLSEARQDAKVSAFLDQDLEAVEAEIYRVEYPELKFRRILPVDGNYPAGVETISYRVMDAFGEAKFIAAGADDLPLADVHGEKFSSHVESIGAGYAYNTHELRASAMAGIPLDRERAQTAMEMIERKMDDAAAMGAPEVNMVGFARHPNVPVDSSAAWSGLTPEQILKEMNDLAQAQVDATKQLHPPDTMLLPPTLHGHVAVTLMNTGNSNGETILSQFLKTQPYIRTVEAWRPLETASETGGKRVICYKRDPKVAKVAIPMETVSNEPERRGLKFIVPLEARYGGVIVKLPLAIRYLDVA